MDPTPATAYPDSPAYFGTPASNQSPTLTLGDWLTTTLVACIPIIGFVMLFVWAFGSSTPPSKANWAKAMLILMAIAVVLGLLSAVFFMASITKMNSTRPT